MSFLHIFSFRCLRWCHFFFFYWLRFDAIDDIYFDYITPFSTRGLHFTLIRLSLRRDTPRHWLLSSEYFATPPRWVTMIISLWLAWYATDIRHYATPADICYADAHWYSAITPFHADTLLGLGCHSLLFPPLFATADRLRHYHDALTLSALLYIFTIFSSPRHADITLYYIIFRHALRRHWCLRHADDADCRWWFSLWCHALPFSSPYAIFRWLSRCYASSLMMMPLYFRRRATPLMPPADADDYCRRRYIIFIIYAISPLCFWATLMPPFISLMIISPRHYAEYFRWWLFSRWLRYHYATAWWCLSFRHAAKLMFTGARYAYAWCISPFSFFCVATSFLLSLPRYFRYFEPRTLRCLYLIWYAVYAILRATRCALFHMFAAWADAAAVITRPHCQRLFSSLRRRYHADADFRHDTLMTPDRLFTLMMFSMPQILMPPLLSIFR